MKQTLALIFILGFNLTIFAQTQTEMNIESNERFKSTDQELNEVYQLILEDYQTDTLFIEKLKASQRLWIKFRDSELEMKYPESDKRLYGSMYPMCATAYLDQLTNDRIKKLKEWLEPIPKGEGCVGSVKYR